VFRENTSKDESVIVPAYKTDMDGEFHADASCNDKNDCWNCTQLNAEQTNHAE